VDFTRRTTLEAFLANVLIASMMFLEALAVFLAIRLVRIALVLRLRNALFVGLDILSMEQLVLSVIPPVASALVLWQPIVWVALQGDIYIRMELVRRAVILRWNGNWKGQLEFVNNLVLGDIFIQIRLVYLIVKLLIQRKLMGI